VEPIVIGKSKERIVFYLDRLEGFKKDKIFLVVYYNKIKEITYNPKFGFKDLFLTIFSWLTYVADLSRLKNVLVISLKDSYDSIAIKMSNDEFEKVKDIFGIPIEIV
jgi:hypothetical protein